METLNTNTGIFLQCDLILDLSKYIALKWNKIVRELWRCYLFAVTIFNQSAILLWLLLWKLCLRTLWKPPKIHWLDENTFHVWEHTLPAITVFCWNISRSSISPDVEYFRFLTVKNKWISFILKAPYAYKWCIKTHISKVESLAYDMHLCMHDCSTWFLYFGLQKQAGSICDCVLLLWGE
jgi:hypothetical protein